LRQYDFGGLGDTGSIQSVTDSLQAYSFGFTGDSDPQQMLCHQVGSVVESGSGSAFYMLRSSPMKSAHGTTENRCVLTLLASLLVSTASSIGRWAMWPVPAVWRFTYSMRFDSFIAYMASGLRYYCGQILSAVWYLFSFDVDHVVFVRHWSAPSVFLVFAQFGAHHRWSERFVRSKT
jgi:hypothetical protein